MKVAVVSNYFNHHQQPLADALYRLTEGQFRFIETSRMREERRQLGYGQEALPEYVLHTDREYDLCMEWLRTADAVIAGSAPQKLLRQRIRDGKLLFRYSERPLKNGPEWKKYLPRLLRWHMWNPPGKPIYMLCASAYTAGDYARFGLFRRRAYRWGYFPQMTPPPEGEKDRNHLLWVGRMLPLKHPEAALEAVKRLRLEGYPVTLTYIGTGELEPRLRRQAEGLGDCVRFLGPVKPWQVRRHMDEAGVFLFTSDRQEGWGAVLNEAMNSGCAVVASHAVGSVPFLLRDGENGLIYQSENVDMLCEKVRLLLRDPDWQAQLGREALRSIEQEWNAETAARRLLQLAQRILDGEREPDLFASGPCSRAKRREDSGSFGKQR